MAGKPTIAVVTIAIDRGENSLHVIGLDARGVIVLRDKVMRARIVAWLANMPPCLKGIEAGRGTRYDASACRRRLGLIPGQISTGDRTILGLKTKG